MQLKGNRQYGAAVEEALSKLNPKERRFAEEYMIVLNARAAVIRMGLTKDNATHTARRYMAKPLVRDAIKALMEERSAAAMITAERVLIELARIAFANIGEFFDVDDDGLLNVDIRRLTADQTAAISEIQIDRIFSGTGEERKEGTRIKFKLHDKRQALISLGEHLGMFAQRHVVGNIDDAPFRLAIAHIDYDGIRRKRES